MGGQTTEVDAAWYKLYSHIEEVTISIKALQASGEPFEKRIIFIRPKKIRQLHDNGGIISDLIEQVLIKCRPEKHA